MLFEDVFFDGLVFVFYFVVGDFDYEFLFEYVEVFECGGVDVIEFGFLFLEFIVEGLIIQNVVVWLFEGGMMLMCFFEFVEDFDVLVLLVCMIYYNFIYCYGDEFGLWLFVEKVVEVGIEGFVVFDLLVEEVGLFCEVCDEFGFDFVFIVVLMICGECFD